MPSLEELSHNLRAADVLDVLVVAAVIYVALAWLRPRASKAATIAVLILVALNAVAQSLDMYLTLIFLRAGLVLFLVALVVVFQADIRRAFSQLSAWSHVAGGRGRKPGEATLEVLTEAASTLAEQRIGALIVIAGREPLDDHIRGGTALDGRVSLPLLHSIFFPKTQGHDGAVILEEDKVLRFGAHLPLSENRSQIGSRGTRHAAALGISERCDALALVVSEERGTISLAHGGELTRVAPGAPLASRLRQFQEATRIETRESPGTWLGNNFAMLMLSALLACGSWMLLAYRVETVQRVFHHVPVEYRNLPKNWSVVEVQPENVRVTITGSERAFDSFDPGKLVISLNLNEIHEGTQSLPITAEMLRLPADLSVRAVDTQAVELTAYEMTTVMLPVRPIIEGKLRSPLNLVGYTLTPERLPVILRRSDLSATRELVTDTIWLEDIEEDTIVNARVLLPPYATLAGGQKATVAVKINVSHPQIPVPSGEPRSARRVPNGEAENRPLTP